MHKAFGQVNKRLKTMLIKMYSILNTFILNAEYVYTQHLVQCS